MTFLEMQDAVYFWLGTTDANRAFQRSQIKRILNEVQDSVYEDLQRTAPDMLTSTATLIADTTDDTAYILGSQDPAITNVSLIVEVRVTDSQGAVLREVPFSERYRQGGSTYSVVGQESPTLYRSGTGGDDLYFAYVPTVAVLSADSDSPTWLFRRFHDVLTLKAAQTASGSGNEQQFSPDLAIRLADREAQLWQAVGLRSLDPMIQRTR